MTNIPLTLKAIVAACLAVVQLSNNAYAEDVAILVGNFDYQTQPQIKGQVATAVLQDNLRKAGFSTVSFENMVHDQLNPRIERLVPELSNADRLVVFIQGHIVQTKDQPWLLATDAAVPSHFNVGAEGLPLGPLFDLAGDFPGASVIAIVEQDRRAFVGEGLTVGYAPTDIPQGVTVLSGRLNALVEFVIDDVLVPGTSIAESLKGEREINGFGYLPRNDSFIDMVSGQIAKPPEAEVNPEEIAKSAEAALRLSRNDKRRVQQSLALLGFDPKGIDGVFGPATRRAMRAWQQTQGADTNGYLNAELVQSLFAQANARVSQLEEEARQKQAREDARDNAYWRSTGKGASKAAIRAYLDKYPDGLFSETANDRLGEIEQAKLNTISTKERRAWDAAVTEDGSAAYQKYLDRYPNGAFAAEAKSRLAERKQTEIQAHLIRRYKAEENRIAGNTAARKLVETRLRNLGLKPGKIDGTFNKATRKALRRFQQARGLDVTGFVNQPTMVRLLLGG